MPSQGNKRQALMDNGAAIAGEYPDDQGGDAGLGLYGDGRGFLGVGIDTAGSVVSEVIWVSAKAGEARKKRRVVKSGRNADVRINPTPCDS